MTNEHNEHYGYCPVCKTTRPSLPQPAVGTCAYCMSHMMVVPDVSVKTTECKPNDSPR